MLPPGIWSLRVAEGGRLVGVSRVLASNERQSSQGARIGLVVFSFHSPKDRFLPLSCWTLASWTQATASVYISIRFLFIFSLQGYVFDNCVAVESAGPSRRPSASNPET